MPQIRAEREHLVIHIQPITEPIQDGINGERVPEVMYAGPAPVLIMSLGASQANTLANMGKVVPCATIACPFTVFLDKKGRG